MTNNPTIDGVSRSALERLVAIHDPRITDRATLWTIEAQWQSAAKEVRELLAAPVVDRQEPVYWRCRTRGRNGPSDDFLIFPAGPSVDCMRLGDSVYARREDLTDWQAFYTAPPEVAELQAEIERLQRAEKNDLIAYKAAIERQQELREALEQAQADLVRMTEGRDGLRSTLDEANKVIAWQRDEKPGLAELSSLRTQLAERDALLRLARQFVVNGVDLGCIRMPDADTPDPAHDLVPKIDAALSASAEPANKESAQ